MGLFWWLFGISAGLFLLILAVAFFCFYRIFYFSPAIRRKTAPDALLKADTYAPYRTQMADWKQKARALPCKEVSITSFDGLTLHGRLYEYAPGAPVELLIHGYKGDGERDMSGGIFRCFALERSALVIDHRAAGKSDGSVITFGVNESRDCALWVDFLIRELGEDVKIILTGISMGAATVMIMAGYPLPKNVVGVLADCGYTSARDIIKKIMRELHYPADLLYPFARLGAKLFGRFDPDERSPIASMANSKLPILFIHGESDDFVPADMSVKNHAACVSAKKLVLIPGAGHALCYPTDSQLYLKEVREFFLPYLK